VNLAACAALPQTPENRVWYRLIETGYVAKALIGSRPAGPARTQDFGGGFFLTKIEGLRMASAKVPYCRVLAVLRESLRAGRSLTFAGSSFGKIVHRI